MTTATRTGRTWIACQCAQITGSHCPWIGPRADTVHLEWMPAYLRASHQAAGNAGIYPHNGAVRVRVSPDCAAAILDTDPEWTTDLSQEPRP
jgi:hypothetical protein